MTRAVRYSRSLTRLFICLPFLLAFEANRAAAQDISRGKGTAVLHCSRCHSIEKTGDSPVAEAPAFRTFSAKWPINSLEEALAEGIVVGHPMMPEFKFEPPDIANLLAYIESIQP